MTDRTQILRWIGAAVALITVAAMVYRAATLQGEPYLGMSERGAEIALVIPGGPADRAGLQGGDRILSINSETVERLTDVHAALRRAARGRPVTLRIDRSGEERRVHLSPEPLPFLEVLWLRAHAAIAIATLLVGTVVFLRKGGRLTAVFFGSCLGLATLLFRPHPMPQPWGYALEASLGQALSLLFPGLLLHFFLLFPYERPILRRHAILHLAPYLPGLALLALTRLPGTHGGAGRSGLMFETVAAFYALAALVLAVILFARAYRGSRLPTVRQKLRIALTGTLLGLLPLLLLLAVRTAAPHVHIPGDRLATLMVFFLPASFGYAILRHGIFEIEFIVKRSLVYSAMTAALILTYFAAYFTLHALLANVTGISERIASALTVVFVFIAMSPLRVRLQERIDRWVYPDRYETRRALRDAGAALRDAAGNGGIESALVQTTRALFDAKQAGLFRPEPQGESLALGAVLQPLEGVPWPSVAGAGAESTRGDAPVPRIGRHLADPLFRFGRPMLRGDLEAELPYGYLPGEDIDALERLQASAFVPLASGSRRLGVLVLGPRRFGEPYSPPDLELLEGLQSQAVLALDNAFHVLESESRAGLKQELEVARSLQEQLLPRRLPALPSLEIAARNIPSREIGGDYYDCLETNPHEVVFAIGDVSGKGVPAALLMANVQAIFRAEATAGRTPAQVLERMNRRLCAIDSPERFVSFFCGRLDPVRRRFDYSNAGHLQPIVVRSDGTLERLDRGGLLLGIHEDAPYEGDSVPFHPGDLLVLFTDGVVERGGVDTPFGEGELMVLVARNRHLSAPDLLGRILDEVQMKCGPAPDDDTTLMVIKAL